MRVFVLSLFSTAVVLSAACPALVPLPLDLPAPPPVKVFDDVIGALADAVFEKFACEEIVRPSTLTRLRAVLENADAATIQALLLNPQDLASIVALGGWQVEAPVIVARQLWSLVQSGVAADLVNSGWEGVQCGAALPVLCTAGSGLSTVSCDVDGDAAAVHLSFTGCSLGGTVYDGALSFTRVVDDNARAGLGFAGFTLNEIRRLDGQLQVKVGAGPDAFVAAVTAPSVFAVIDHGGLDAGLECGAETTFEAVAVDVANDHAVVQMIALRADENGSVGIETFGNHLSFGDPAQCDCPQPGSGAFIDVPRPLGRAGESARARITWQSSTDPTLCSLPQVQLESWPTDCDVLVDGDGDCAQGATEASLGLLLGALCATP